MQAEELISILIRISKSDNQFDPYELSYILNVGKHLGISDNVVESLVHDPLVNGLIIPKAEEDRMTILYYMLFLMRIDNSIADSEREMIHHYGFKLGFSRAMINDFLQLMENYNEKRIPTQEMLSIIKKYQN